MAAASSDGNGGRRVSLTKADAKLVVVQPGRASPSNDGRRSPAVPPGGYSAAGEGRRSPAPGPSRSSPAASSNPPKQPRQRRRRKPRRPSVEYDYDDDYDDDAVSDGGSEGSQQQQQQQAEHFAAGIEETGSERFDADARGNAANANLPQGASLSVYGPEGEEGVVEDVYPGSDEIAMSTTRRITWADEHGMPIFEVRTRTSPSHHKRGMPSLSYDRCFTLIDCITLFQSMMVQVMRVVLSAEHDLCCLWTRH